MGAVLDHWRKLRWQRSQWRHEERLAKIQGNVANESKSIDAQAIAYQNGMTPIAGKTTGEDIAMKWANNASEAGMSILSMFGGKGKGSSQQTTQQQPQQQQQSFTMWIVGGVAIVLGFLFFNRKKARA